MNAFVSTFLPGYPIASHCSCRCCTAPSLTNTQTKGEPVVRISPVVPETATPDEAAALQKIREAWGGVPNLWAVIARSPALTEAVLAFGRALEKGVFSGAISEQLAIAVANEDRCPYCLAGHTAAGLARGLDAEAVADARARSEERRVGKECRSRGWPEQ